MLLSTGAIWSLLGLLKIYDFIMIIDFDAGKGLKKNMDIVTII